MSNRYKVRNPDRHVRLLQVQGENHFDNHGVLQQRVANAAGGDHKEIPDAAVSPTPRVNDVDLR